MFSTCYIKIKTVRCRHPFFDHPTSHLLTDLHTHTLHHQQQLQQKNTTTTTTTTIRVNNNPPCSGLTHPAASICASWSTHPAPSHLCPHTCQTQCRPTAGSTKKHKVIKGVLSSILHRCLHRWASLCCVRWSEGGGGCPAGDNKP
ncbi:hypothetical protein E2C01_078375 [Portunus trituberculatus]|uniref:Uncharacterized protein n=1 Tax=Portunus trituberculatus TaxID=210409 RepID=A0A5B7IGU5_PORTR|nr:hypothetical protein [Portunus trituberculatus]